MTECNTGYWVNDSFCSVCKRFPVPADMGISFQNLTELFEFCPHCGADMVGATVETFPVKGRNGYNGET